MKIFITIMITILFNFHVVKAAEDPRVLEVKFEWLYENFPAKIEMYELSQSSSDRLLETKNVKLDSAIEKYFVGNLKVKDSKVTLQKGMYKNLLLVIDNPTNNTIYFGAAPHSFNPPDDVLGVKFLCLCLGDSFRIKPQSRWYRVVQIRAESFVVANKISLSHQLFSIPRDKVIIKDGDYN